jgi:Tfp pilus assembly protein PilV
MVAATDWADAAIAIAGISMITVIVSVVVWQVFATGRTGLSARRENAYQKLAEEAAAAQRTTGETLEKAVAELAALRKQTGELERLLKEVE